MCLNVCHNGSWGDKTCYLFYPTHSLGGWSPHWLNVANLVDLCSSIFSSFSKFNDLWCTLYALYYTKTVIHHTVTCIQLFVCVHQPWRQRWISDCPTGASFSSLLVCKHAITWEIVFYSACKAEFDSYSSNIKHPLTLSTTDAYAVFEMP